ncbi:MAG: efflux RND transporter periplasmic adaptor subunit [Anaerolineales bacterium]|jgi:RND family efflux transporter MFP subunit
MRKLLVWVFLFTFLTGCTPPNNQEVSETVQGSSLQIEDKTVSASGTVFPAKWANAAFFIGGKGLETYVTVGEEVREDQLLATVRQDSAEVGIRSAEAQLDSAKAALEQAEESEFATEQDVDVARAAVEIAEAGLEQAQLNWTNTHLFSPITGTVIDIFVNPGEVVSPGTPIIMIADLTTLKIQTTDLNEVDVAKIDIGSSAEVVFDALPDTIVKGKVVEISLRNAAVAGVYYSVTIELEEIPEKLLWGMSAFVKIEIEG